MALRWICVRAEARLHPTDLAGAAHPRRRQPIHVQHPQEADLGGGTRRTGPRPRSGRPRRAAFPPGYELVASRATSRSSARRMRASDPAPASNAAATNGHGREDALNQSSSQAAERRSADHATARRRRRSQRQTNKAGSLATELVAERHQSSTRRGRFATSGVVAGSASQPSANADRSTWIVASSSRARVERRGLEPLTQARPAPVIVAPEPSVIRVNAAFPVIPGRNTKGVGAPAVDAERRVNDDRRRSPQLVESSPR